ncbi:MAG TPA: hypothetical protein VHM19_05580, partial [Polyangiales bacterium]|nr:hypothetical protein [Polyangiales bacterium]
MVAPAVLASRFGLWVLGLSASLLVACSYGSIPLHRGMRDGGELDGSAHDDDGSVSDGGLDGAADDGSAMLDSGEHGDAGDAGGNAPDKPHLEPLYASAPAWNDQMLVADPSKRCTVANDDEYGKG